MILTPVSGLLALSLLNHGVLAQNQPDVITEDTHFYGQSPPVYPTR
jgi:beta-glucosidase